MSQRMDSSEKFINFVQDLFGTTDSIPLHEPRFSDREKEEVLCALESTYVSSVGEDVDRLEDILCGITGSRYVVATSSGTAALHVSLVSSGVQAGDEVITQSLTFVGTCNAIAYCGALPIFLDVERETLGLCPVALSNFLEESAVICDDGECWNKVTGNRIRACLPVNTLGHPARVQKIAEICQRFRIRVIEDAAESLGSFRQDEHTGIAGDCGIVSFNGNKIVTTGGGGAVLTNDEKLAKKVRHLTTTAKLPHRWHFFHDQVGFNYRLPNLNAALGCAQLKKLDKFLHAKRKLAQSYQVWAKEQELEVVIEPKNTRSNYWLNAFLFENSDVKNQFLTATNDSKVMTRPMWTPMHTLPMYQDCVRGDLSVSEDIERRAVCVPSSVIEP